MQPGHDEIRPRRSQINGSGSKPAFLKGLRHADRLSRHHSHEPRSLERTESAEGRIPPFVGCTGLGHHHPYDTGDLGRQGDGDLVGVHSCLKTIEPCSKSVSRPIKMCHARAGTVDDHSAQISVAALAYPEQFRFTACRVFSGNKTEPSGHIARLSELSGGSGRCQKSRRREWANARDGHQSTCGIA